MMTQKFVVEITDVTDQFPISTEELYKRLSEIFKGYLIGCYEEVY